MECQTIKEVSMPGCYSGVLKVSTRQPSGTVLTWFINRDGEPGVIYKETTVDSEGNITIDSADTGAFLNYLNTYRLSIVHKLSGAGLNIQGYDYYRLIPYKNNEEVIDVVI
jgi:hypothetical protein